MQTKNIEMLLYASSSFLSQNYTATGLHSQGWCWSYMTYWFDFELLQINVNLKMSL